MKPEAQRIVIAEACGWTNIRKCTCPIMCGDNPNGPSGHLPNYCSDLNEMHEAEKVLVADRKLSRSYFDALTVVVARSELDNLGTVRATAAQRAEAFLLAIGKWDSENTALSGAERNDE